jgi:cation/acetate symporter
VVLIIFSPAVSGGPKSMFTGVDFSWFPLSNPGLVSIPVAFILGYVGSKTSKESDEAKYAEMEVRSLTGAHAEKAVAH